MNYELNIDFQKCGGLVPAIIQDAQTKTVLMLGYMNEESLRKTQETGLVTFFSRSRQCLWTKGETSGNYLHVVSIKSDCDNDTLLIQANPDGPTCHTGTDTCWGEENKPNPLLFLSELSDFIEKRHEEMPEGSYTTSLFKDGLNRMAQKVGEEALELVIQGFAHRGYGNGTHGTSQPRLEETLKKQLTPDPSPVRVENNCTYQDDTQLHRC